MIANLILKNEHYYCSNCMMRQSGIPVRCCFCEYQFSNWEEIAYKEIMLDIEEEIRKMKNKGEYQNESNIH